MNTGHNFSSAAIVASCGILISSTLMVTMIANTPSLNASRRVLVIKANVKEVRTYLKKYFQKNLFGNLKVTYICVTFKLHIMQKEIKQTWYFNQSPQTVWEYLTKPELIEQWLGKADFQPVAGHKFRIIGSRGSEIDCEVLEVTPFTKLTYSWQKKSAKDNKFYNSKVVWTLIPKKNGTELQLVHTGFIAIEDYTAHNNGWKTIGNRFVELLNAIKK